MRSPLALVAMALALASCARPDPSVLATYDGGQVRLADLEARILELPPNRRGAPRGEDAQAWRSGLIREIAFERLLIAEARRSRADADPEFGKRSAALRKRLLASLYLREHLPEPAPLREEELRAYYDAHPELFRRPPRREVYTIFKRVERGADPAAARREMETLRKRALAGESFIELAAAHSDSETRHRKGLWGWIQAGSVGGDLEKVIFGLAERTPSAVLATREGLHLFWVSEAEPEVRLEFPESRSLALRMLARERQQAAIRELLDRHRPADSFVPSPGELSTLLASGDAKALILSLGEERLYLDELVRLVQESGDGPDKPAIERARDIVEERYRQEVASRLALESGLDRSKAFAERDSALEERALAEYEVERQLRAGIDEGALARFFEDNRQRYTEPMLVRVAVLSVPLGPSAPRRMAELERARPDLDAGRTTLEDLARRLGGEVQDMGWRTLDQLGQSSPGLPYWALELSPERHSPPFRTGRALLLAKLLSRRDPAPQPLEAARPRLTEDYIRQNGQSLRSSLQERWLRQKHFVATERPSNSRLTPEPS